MKVLRVYRRTMFKRTSSRYFKKDVQLSVFYDDKEYRNHYEDINNPRLRVKFDLILTTRKKCDVEKCITFLGKTEAEKWLKETLNSILEKENKKSES